MVTSVQPQGQVVALMHWGDNYNLFDSKKALARLPPGLEGALPPK